MKFWKASNITSAGLVLFFGSALIEKVFMYPMPNILYIVGAAAVVFGTIMFFTGKK